MTDIPANSKRAQANGPRTPKTPEKSPEEIIKDAPLRTSESEQTNPEAVQQVEQKPWRVGTSMAEDELLFITEKASYNIPMELVLRMDYLISQKKARSLGKRTNKTALVIEALDEYTTRELKKLGQKV